LPEFQALYGSEDQCERAVVAARWPQGWHCAHCGCKRYFLTRNGSGRQLWECFICGYQSSSIVGTVMEHTHLALRLWFLAMYLLTQHKNAISALALKRQLGVSYKTAWLLKHKLMQAMDLLCNYQSDMTRQFWKDRYAGVFRANSAIETLDNCPDFPSTEARNQLMGEALFMRAYFYYELASMYNRVPLITTSQTSDVPQASPAEIWGQILLDLKTAADIMPRSVGKST
jgi:transposase-like protein